MSLLNNLNNTRSQFAVKASLKVNKMLKKKKKKEMILRDRNLEQKPK